MSQILRILIYVSLSVIFHFVSVAQNQESKWLYLGTSADGLKFYYQKQLIKLKNGNSAIWTKSVYNDGSYLEMISELDCSTKRYNILEQTLFSSADKLLDQKKNVDWNYIAPDSIAESYRLIVCENKTVADTVEVITREANLRKSPIKNSIVLRTAKKGELFSLSFGKTVAGWYNIVDEKTQEDYWVHGNNIKILDSQKPKTKFKNSPK